MKTYITNRLTGYKSSKLGSTATITYTKRTPRYVQANRLLHIQDTRRDKQRKHMQQGVAVDFISAFQSLLALPS